MKSIKEYKIVTGDSPEFLSERITKLISEGWVIYGNPYFEQHKTKHCQSMVKYEESETKEQLNS